MTDPKKPKLPEFRILISDVKNPFNPIAMVLGVSAETAAKAHEVARGIEDPINGAVPNGVRKLGLRFEEVLPLMRQGHPVRRAAWPATSVLQMHTTQLRIDMYERNVRDPYIRYEYVAKWGEEAHVDRDILTDDWGLVSNPQKLPARNPGAQYTQAS